MILSYPKSRRTLIALIALTALIVLLILLLYKPENPEERPIIAIIIGSLGAFISVSSARFVMNSEILSLKYMLSNAISLERCAGELRSAARRMRKGSESRFQTAQQAADAFSAIGRYDEAIGLLRDMALERPIASRSTSFLLAALRYSILKGGDKEREDYLAFLRSGGSRSPIKALRVAGVDMASPLPVKAATEHFASLLGQFRSLRSV